MKRKEVPQASRLDTQYRLVSACRELIIAAGVETCSVQEICQRAGFSRGAFYSNFSTKDELFAAVAADEYGRLSDKLTQLKRGWTRQKRLPVRGRSTKQRTILADCVHTAAAAIADSTQLFILHAELSARAIRNPAWGAELTQAHREFLTAMTAVLTAALNAAGRKIAPADSAGLTHATIALLLRADAITAWARSQNHYHCNEYARLQARARALGQDLPPSQSSAHADSLALAKAVTDTIVTLLFSASSPA